MKFGRLIRGENGFTLIEMVIAVAITGIIGLGTATSTYHVMIHGSRNADATSASQHVLNAIHWISRDVQMAQSLGSRSVPHSLLE